jgi:hypothetical protein
MDELAEPGVDRADRVLMIDRLPVVVDELRLGVDERSASVDDAPELRRELAVDEPGGVRVVAGSLPLRLGSRDLVERREFGGKLVLLRLRCGCHPFSFVRAQCRRRHSAHPCCTW